LIFTSWSSSLRRQALSIKSVFSATAVEAKLDTGQVGSAQSARPSLSRCKRDHAVQQYVIGLLSPTSRAFSAVPLSKVPIPPFHSRSTGALSDDDQARWGVSLSVSYQQARIVWSGNLLELRLSNKSTLQKISF